MRTPDPIRPWGRKLTVAALAVTLMAAGAVAFAATDSESAVINGCVRQGSIISQGSLRVVDSPDQCRANETALSWNQQGPQGPAGPAGPPGPGAIPCPPADPAEPSIGTGVAAFARFDGIMGDSTNQQHPNEVELTSVEGGILRPSGDPCAPGQHDRWAGAAPAHRSTRCADPTGMRWSTGAVRSSPSPPPSEISLLRCHESRVRMLPATCCPRDTPT